MPAARRARGQLPKRETAAATRAGEQRRTREGASLRPRFRAARSAAATRSRVQLSGVIRTTPPGASPRARALLPLSLSQPSDAVAGLLDDHEDVFQSRERGEGGLELALGSDVDLLGPDDPPGVFDARLDILGSEVGVVIPADDLERDSRRHEFQQRDVPR